MSFAYWIVVLLYAALVIFIGYRIRTRGRRAGKEDGSPGDAQGNLEFWMARRSLSGLRLGISLTSGWLMLGWIGFGMSQIYLYGATGLWILPIPWFVLTFIIIWMVPFVRRIGAISLPQSIEKRFGRFARMLMATFSFGVFIAWTQAELFMAGTLMEPFLGVPAWLCMVVLVIPILAYTYLGGFRAIVTTDLVQFLIMVIFMSLLAVTALSLASDATDGNVIGSLKAATPPWGGEGTTFSFGVLGWVFPIVMLVGYLPGWMIEQDLTLRIQAAKSTKEARKGAVYSMVGITLFILVLPSIAAFCALVAFPPVDGVPPDIIGSDATGIISAYILEMAPILQIVMLVGLVACQMSTVDTFANVSAMPIAYDLVDPLLRKRQSNAATRSGSARWISMGTIVVALLLALISDKLGDVYYISSGVLSACIAVPAVAVFWKRTTKTAVIVAAFLGFLGTVGMYLYEYKVLQYADPELPNYYTDVLPGFLAGAYGYLYVATGVVVSVIALVVTNLLARQPKDALQDAAVAIHPIPIDDLDAFTAELGDGAAG